MNPRTPCKNCERRHLHCHAHCELYKAMKARLDQERAAAAREKQDEYDYRCYCHSSMKTFDRKEHSRWVRGRRG